MDKLKEFMVQTVDGRNIVWSGFDFDDVSRHVKYRGYKATRITTLEQYEREQRMERVNA